MKKATPIKGRLNQWLKNLNQTLNTGKESDVRRLPSVIHFLVSAS
jgi:hypothetical protein